MGQWLAKGRGHTDGKVQLESVGIRHNIAQFLPIFLLLTPHPPNDEEKLPLPLTPTVFPCTLRSGGQIHKGCHRTSNAWAVCAQEHCSRDTLCLSHGLACWQRVTLTQDGDQDQRLPANHLDLQRPETPTHVYLGILPGSPLC